jgi:hypothetical protein
MASNQASRILIPESRSRATVGLTGLIRQRHGENGSVELFVPITWDIARDARVEADNAQYTRVDDYSGSQRCRDHSAGGKKRLGPEL